MNDTEQPNIPDAKFLILTTTFGRPDLVLRSIKSVQQQTFKDWCLVVVNDDPQSDYSKAQELLANDARCVYLRNTKNIGKNASLNRALTLAEKSHVSGGVIFLDDDDWLTPECLEQFARATHATNTPWVCARLTTTEGSELTTYHVDAIYYPRDYLIWKRLSGDATHCISFPLIRSCRFSESVKNGEEWLYFSCVSKHIRTLHMLPFVATLTNGYHHSGLTHQLNKQSRKQKLQVLWQVCKELSRKRIWSYYTALYMFLRFGKVLISFSK